MQLLLEIISFPALSFVLNVDPQSPIHAQGFLFQNGGLGAGGGGVTVRHIFFFNFVLIVIFNTIVSKISSIYKFQIKAFF